MVKACKWLISSFYGYSREKRLGFSFNGHRRAKKVKACKWLSFSLNGYSRVKLLKHVNDQAPVFFIVIVVLGGKSM